MKKGVLLLNMGGPDSVTAVKPFLYNLFKDPYIANFGIMQKPLAWLISNLRAGKVKKAYEKIGGGSPLKEITEKQAQALQEALGEKFMVKAGMRYWHPFIEKAVNDFERWGIKKIVALSLYPQFCRATTSSVLNKFKELAEGKFDFTVIDSWCDYPPFVSAWVNKIEEALKKYGDCFILFSAHGIPLSLHKKGDPYVSEVERTVRAIVEKMKLTGWKICYQSRTGPLRWTEPSVEQTIEELAEKGIKKALLVPVSFVSDCIETLYEIDILYRKRAQSVGVELHRVESLNASADFISALKNLVFDSLRRS